MMALQARTGHVPFKMLQRMATQGDLTHSFLPPFCAACKYGKQRKCPWCTKGPQQHL